MTVFVDPRFGSEREGQRSSHRAVAEALPTFGVEVEHSHLDFGDFMFLGNGPDGPLQIGIELKAVSDLVNSVRSGRMAEQLIGMAGKYGRSYLVVEGLYRAGRKNGMLEVPRGVGYQVINAGPRPVFWAEIEKFLVGAGEAGVRVHHTRSSFETARVIAQVFTSYWGKEYDEHTSFNTLYRPAPMQLVKEDETTRRVRLVAACLPSIGWKRSKAVAERFGSIRALANADAGEWLGIDGIGKGIAGQVEQALCAAISKGSVRPGHGVRVRSARHPQQRKSHGLDSTRAAQRRVSEARTGRRFVGGSQSRRSKPR